MPPSLLQRRQSCSRLPVSTRLWRYTSLPDFIRIVAAVTVALLLAVFISFVGSRLEGVARSVPVIQWFLLVSAMLGPRCHANLAGAKPKQLSHHPQHVENVLIVGVSHLTELFLEFVPVCIEAA